MSLAGSGQDVADSCGNQPAALCSGKPLAELARPAVRPPLTVSKLVSHIKTEVPLQDVCIHVNTWERLHSLFMEGHAEQCTCGSCLVC